jgi:hypothetical protein
MISRGTDREVRERAGHACEYCRMPQSARRLRFPIDHIVAQQHHGSDDPSNLALCCGRCNRHKGPNLSGVDPVSGALTRLFHPRNDRWAEHFRWSGLIIEGISEVGRTTVDVLRMNHPEDVAVRRELVASGLFPPPDGTFGPGLPP